MKYDDAPTGPQEGKPIGIASNYLAEEKSNECFSDLLLLLLLLFTAIKLNGGELRIIVIKCLACRSYP